MFPVAVVVLAVGCALLIVIMTTVLARWLVLLIAVVMVVGGLRSLAPPGWPPAGVVDQVLLPAPSRSPHAARRPECRCASVPHRPLGRSGGSPPRIEAGRHRHSSVAKAEAFPPVGPSCGGGRGSIEP